jgi:EAL domain-containing protein (putative c-di-GMP-specific phosphodiesterase class I)/CheY-like chemotaxis protein
VTERIRVVVADDDVGVRDAVADIVEAQPTLEVVGTAADGREAVDHAVRLQPDVVLMDVRMPGVDGPRATREIRAQGLPCRVIALSAYEDRASLLSMLHAGAVGYLVKGCSVSEIVDAVERAMKGLSTLSGEVSAELVSEIATRLEEDERAARRRTELLERMRVVLDGGLEVVFQPILDLVSGTPVGVEALSRFPSDPGTPPYRWFEDAAEVGLRVELELAAVQGALLLRPQLPDDLYVSVNIGPEALRTPTFSELLGAHGLPGLVVEVTEHAPVEDYEALASVLLPLRSLGLRLAVDDAGAGFASLRHILGLDPDIIKLDMDLTRGLDSDLARRALATALISFANEIGAQIVAEGIEGAAEVHALRHLGVRFGQGFHLGRPGPVAVCLPGSDRVSAAERR